MELTGLLQEHLSGKFAALKRRTTAVIDQLSDEDINWSPNEDSNSIANLAAHIRGNVHQRIEVIFRNVEDTRDRDQEFESGLSHTKQEVLTFIEHAFDLLIETVQTLKENDWLEKPYANRVLTQSALSSDSTWLDIYLQMSTHLSEHVGQISYIAKLRLGDNYVTTTVPKRK